MTSFNILSAILWPKFSHSFIYKQAGDRKTSRQSKKTSRQGIVNLDEINFDEVTRADPDEISQDVKKKPAPKKRTGPRIKNTKDKKDKKKAKAAAILSGKRGPYKKGIVL